MTASETQNSASAMPVPGGPPSGYIDNNDDMYDSPEELQGDALLPRALRLLSEISAPYWRANHEAMILQARHRHITSRALFAATAAVVLAIIQLPILKRLEGWGEIVPLIEAVAVGLAFYYVSKGIKQAVQKHWLLERHQAERFRFLKYRRLLALITETKDDPGLKHWKQVACRKASNILKMKEPDVQQWMREFYRQSKDDKSLLSIVSESDFNDILDFYRHKRLDRQVRYLCQKSASTGTDDSYTRFWPPFLFLVSLVFALIHFGIDIVDASARFAEERTCLLIFGWIESHGISWAKEHSVWFITGAALLPVVIAAIRTHRSANEYSRNTLRFSSMYVELRAKSDQLAVSQDSTAKLRILWEIEESLESEHRDWLRLMEEAEWYG